MPRCRRGGNWGAPSVWPLCVDPPRCLASAAPALPADSGLAGTYTDLLEAETTQMRCNDTQRELVGGNSNMTSVLETLDPATNITSTETVFLGNSQKITFCRKHNTISVR